MKVTLNGWQRLWVVITLMWTCAVGVVAWNTWPPTFVSMVPNTELPPVGADVTYLMDGVLNRNEILTRARFAARLKAKYPVYANMTDEELVNRTLEKFPYYKSYIFPAGFPDSFVSYSPEEVRVTNHANRVRAIRSALALWLLPSLALYALGYSARWVYRGFRST